MWYNICLTPGKESIKVNAAATWENNNIIIEKPKKKEQKQGKEAERIISIPHDLAEMLRNAPHKGLYVFTPAQSNGMLTKTNLRRMWKSFHRAVDMKMGANIYRNKITIHAFSTDITPYYLRHTCCTRWFEKEIDLKSVQYMMGHADISTTTKIYMHVTDVNINTAADIIRKAATVDYN